LAYKHKNKYSMKKYILPDLILPSRVDQHWSESGLDSLEYCLDKDYFINYSHAISYDYNSRGFRDSEWPEDFDELQNSIWCIGDSFTVGLGSPHKHIWPYLLSEKTKKRTINVSLDGGSNNWIARRAVEIIKTINPKNIVIMWSYFHRREADFIGTDEERRLKDIEISKESDYENFKMCLSAVIDSKPNNLVNAIIPNAHIPNEVRLKKILKQFVGLKVDKRTDLTDIINNIPNYIGEIEILDIARDGHHFDMLTSKKLVELIQPLLKP